MITLALAAVLHAQAGPDPSGKADRYWIILSSELVAGHEPEGLRKLAAHPELRLQPERLSSTPYKNLMPCYELVVAAVIADRKQAMELSRRLSGLGIDNYAKNAGPWVGPRPELDAYCKDLAQPPQGSAALGLVEPGLGARVELGPAALDALLANAPPLRMKDKEHELWASALPHQAVGPWKVGAELTALGAKGGTQTCTIRSLLVGVAGTPHFGWREHDPRPSRPACGEPSLYLDLQCPQGEPVLILSALGPGQAAMPQGQPRAMPANSPLPPGSEIIATRVSEQAEASAVSVQQSRQTWTLNGRSLELETITWQSGEGWWMCGGEDLYQQAFALREGGRLILPFVPAQGEELIGVFDSDGDGSPELLLQDTITRSRRLVGEGGERVWSRAYCDCPC
jgi:hypothetical protein